jgi:hypothetical protein
MPLKGPCRIQFAGKAGAVQIDERASQTINTTSQDIKPLNNDIWALSRAQGCPL